LQSPPGMLHEHTHTHTYTHIHTHHEFFTNTHINTHTHTHTHTRTRTRAHACAHTYTHTHKHTHTHTHTSSSFPPLKTRLEVCGRNLPKHLRISSIAISHSKFGSKLTFAKFAEYTPRIMQPQFEQQLFGYTSEATRCCDGHEVVAVDGV